MTFKKQAEGQKAKSCRKGIVKRVRNHGREKR